MKKAYVLIAKEQAMSRFGQPIHPLKSVITAKELMMNDMDPKYTEDYLSDGSWNSNPVRFEEDQWWFYDECWDDRLGPYKSKEEAAEACHRYHETL